MGIDHYGSKNQKSSFHNFYMNQNRKIFEFWMKHVFVWPNFTHKIKVLHSMGGKFLNALGISISHPCKIDGFLFQEWTIWNYLLDNGSCTISSLLISSNVWSSWMMDLSIISLGAIDNGQLMCIIIILLELD